MYYKIVQSLNDLLGYDGLMRLPDHLPQTYIFDDTRFNALNLAFQTLMHGENVLITGSPGTGKTALMFMIVKKLMDSGVKVGYLIKDDIGYEHQDYGVIIFIDDLARINHQVLDKIYRLNIKGLLCTSRTEELPMLNRFFKSGLKNMFKIIQLDTMNKEKLKEMLLSYIENESIDIKDNEAVDIIVSKANGLPVYIWQVIRELKISKSALSLDFAKKIPTGMYNYIDSILWDVIDGYKYRYAILLTLLILADLPNYSAHQDFYYAVYSVAIRELFKQDISIEVAVLDDVFDNITRYLARDRYSYAFRLPHDSWADVLRGMSEGPMASEIAKINGLFPEDRRRDLLLKALSLTYNEIIRKSKDLPRVNAFKEFVKKVFTEKELKILGIYEFIYGVKTIVEMPEILDNIFKEIILKEKLDEPIMSKISTLNDKQCMRLAIKIFKYAFSVDNKKLIDISIKLLEKIHLPNAYFNLGVIYAKLGKHEKAFHYFEKVYLAGFGDKALFNMAVAAYKQKDYREALEYLKKYIRLRPYDKNLTKAISLLERIC